MQSAPEKVLSSIKKTPLGGRAYAHLASTYAAARGAESLDRPRWLYRPGSNVPKGKFQYRDPLPVTDADLALCNRLIEAYAHASGGDTTEDGMWNTDVFQERHRELLEPLRDRDAQQLAVALASMFRRDIVIGMATGSMGIDVPSRLGRRVFWLWTLGRLTSLAESLGATRLENPEQGDVGVGLAAGVEPIVLGSEKALGISLDFPDVGAPYGVEVAGRLFTTESPDQIYGAARLLEAVEQYAADSENPHIVEIGGGYGGMAYWAAKMRPLPYTIVDLPIVNVLQGYFLAKSLGHDQVALYKEPRAKVTILPDHALSDIPAPFEVLANKDSMPEIPREALLTYLHWAKESCSTMFYSNNQESGSTFAGESQNIVCDVLAEIGGFERVRREHSWVRRGYVEEVFLKVTALP